MRVALSLGLNSPQVLKRRQMHRYLNILDRPWRQFTMLLRPVSDYLSSRNQRIKLICSGVMGGANSSNAVVDSKGRVYGVHALRIVDSSTFPLLPPGHPQATVCEFQYAIISKDPGLILTYDRYACGKACPGHHRRQLIVKLKDRSLQ